MAFSGFPVMFVSAPSEQCVDIVIVDDSDMEPDEFFEVEIDIQQADSAVSIGPLNRTAVAISDDGRACNIVSLCIRYYTIDCKYSVLKYICENKK
jgi:hypothetical protein